ncbi:MAG TPA: PEP/pyruvate-binding domain-containing protein [Paludibacter sp.]|nr:PEP/pyruvate-binding domain-containing protein [Paludibacter sp.]HPM10140.1 PEP/pyruvate-binding domain-containing protein [Paludibacter sp.]
MLKNNSKARILIALKDRLSLFVIPDILYFTTDAWVKDKEGLLETVTKRFQHVCLAIRSSAGDEDGHQQARAGEYDSVLNVPGNDRHQISAAIEKVIDSYNRKGSRKSEDEVIVQQMVQNTTMSGVVFTHDLNTGAPYYVVNYDDVTGLTNTVTAGDGEYANRTLYIHRGAISALRSERFQKLLLAIHELESVVGSQFLDIEFAIGADLTPFLFQVRAITTQPNWNRAVAKRIDRMLEGIKSFVRNRFKPIPGVFGSTTVLGQMPDWNPAEMIGRAPRALALSLYQHLITDHAWRIARRKMGYAVPAGQPLMVSLAGQPFIDTRMSFHSFLPSAIEPQIANKLVNAWLKRLREKPELHDKVEFDVAITTYSFDIDEKINTLTDDALTQEEEEIFKKLRKQQTLDNIKSIGEGSIDRAFLYINELLRKQKTRTDYNQAFNGVESLFGLIDDCIYLGTVPFSILARHAFIARTILISLSQRDVLSVTEIQNFQSSIKTIAGELVDDMRLFREGRLDRKIFMDKYGHLRPGTYDIMSRRYDQMDDFSLGAKPTIHEKSTQPFSLSASKINKINRFLSVEGFDGIDADKLLEYMRRAIIGREYGKFVFTRTVSDMLELIAAYGEKHGLSREEMSHISIKQLLYIATTSEETSIEDQLREQSEKNAEQHAIAAAIRLPQVLFDEAGIHVIPFQVTNPNFITHKKVTAPCVYLSTDQSIPSLDGKIILIENADPGFDWIFSHPIAGLITEYGGANSHMAIRCAEFGIPAAIGCGEQRFESLVKANQILLDCTNCFIDQF